FLFTRIAKPERAHLQRKMALSPYRRKRLLYNIQIISYQPRVWFFPIPKSFLFLIYLIFNYHLPVMFLLKSYQVVRL
ncbi:MAG: hypothetical protein ACTSYU_10185, partial [Promethearchaeota archaeon]